MIDYQIYGEDNADNLLFIHGALVSQSMWRDQIRFFQSDFRVITCDLPEHGNSKVLTGEYTIEALAEQLSSLLESLKIRRITICGHSLGGMVAQRFAYQNPSLVHTLILAETAYGTRNNFSEKVSTFFASYLLRLTSKKMLIKLSVSRYGKLKKETGEYLAREMDRYSKKTMLRVMGAALNYQGQKYLSQMRMPTLILVGKKNRSTHQQARRMNQLIPNSELKFIGHANHLVNLDNPLEFNSTVADFLYKNPSNS